MGRALPFRLFHLGLVAAICVALTGCGRRGMLEPPPGSPTKASAAQQARVLNDEQDQPGLIQSPNKFTEQPADAKLDAAQRQAATDGAPRAINAPPAPKRTTFLLDPLL